MKDLIEALQIFLKYNDIKKPTHCEVQENFSVVGIPSDDVSKEDADRLAELGFKRDWDNDGCWYSYRFGGAGGA